MEFFLNTLIYFGIFAALGVVSVINPIHSILSLILVFSIAGISIITIGADFIGILYILVYVGAIAVIFLFVIMCINLEPRSQLHKINYFPIVFSISLIIALSFSLIFAELFITESITILVTPWDQIITSANDIEVIGQMFFFFLPLPIIILGLILLVSMIGAIFLTFTEGDLIRRQDVYNKSVSYDFIVREL
jgi:NADH-quinone oxidoreductase subunit J